MVQLPDDLLDAMKAAALQAGRHALKVKESDTRQTTQKSDSSYVTRADEEGEQMIRDALAHYGYGFLGEETGLSDSDSDFQFVVDPIDGTTNYTVGDPDWLVSIGLTYKGEPVAGVTYQPELGKLYFAEKGKGAFLTQGGGQTKQLHAPETPQAYVFDTLFSRHPNFEGQRALHARLFELVPEMTANQHMARFRTTGCPSVPLCQMAEGARTGIIAKPIYWHDIVASAVIAEEAGIKLDLQYEDPNKTSHTDAYSLIAGVPSVFEHLKDIAYNTVIKPVERYESKDGKPPKEAFAKDGIKYGISVGRRQPMHVVHVDCIKEMVEAGLHPVIVIGSVNSAESRFYDPLKNPLTEEQQRIQIERVLGKEGITDYTLLSLKDMGSYDYWASSLSKLLQDNGIKPSEAAFHFRSKKEDMQGMGATIKPLRAGQESLMQYGLAVWESYNRNPEHDTISAWPFRAKDVTKDMQSWRHTVAANEFVMEQSIAAREENPDAALLGDVPITLLDCTLQRLRTERGVNTSDILGGEKVQSVDALEKAIESYMRTPGNIVSGELMAESNEKKRSI